jgi:hypothetical protein
LIVHLEEEPNENFASLAPSVRSGSLELGEAAYRKLSHPKQVNLCVGYKFVVVNEKGGRGTDNPVFTSILTSTG